MNLRKIGLVACCSKKLPNPTKAEDLYCSTLFKKAKVKAAALDAWFILSALHGLVEPGQVIAPYNFTLVGQPRKVRDAWGVRVVQQLRARGLEGCLFVAFAGAVYCDPLTQYLKLERPLKGLRIGQQLVKLSR